MEMSYCLKEKALKLRREDQTDPEGCEGVAYLGLGWWARAGKCIKSSDVGSTADWS